MKIMCEIHEVCVRTRPRVSKHDLDLVGESEGFVRPDAGGINGTRL